MQNNSRAEEFGERRMMVRSSLEPCLTLLFVLLASWTWAGSSKRDALQDPVYKVIEKKARAGVYCVRPRCLNVSTVCCIGVAKENKITHLGQQDSAKCLLFTFRHDPMVSASLV